MRKKLIVSILALSLTLVSALSFVGCAKDISAEEFSKGVATSYKNFYSEREDYETFKDVGFTFNTQAEMLENVEWEYTPSGATEAVKKTYVEKYAIKLNASYKVKRIGEDLVISVNATKETSSEVYNTYGADTSAPLTPTYSVEKTVDEWYFGVDNGTYFVRRNLSEQEGEQTLGELENTKVYKEYSSKLDYEMSVLNVLNRIDDRIISMTYEQFTDSSSPTELSFLLENVYLEDGKYTMEVDFWLPTIEDLDKSATVYNVNSIVQYSENGPEYYDYKMEGSGDNGSMKTTNLFEFSYNVLLDALTDPLNGYTLDNSINVNECVYTPSMF